MDLIVINKNKILLLLSVFLLFFLNSCDFKHSNDIDNIISIIIEDYVKEDLMYMSINKDLKDDLLINGKFIVAVYTELNPILENFGLRKNKAEYKGVFEKLQSLKEKMKFTLKDDNILGDVHLVEFTPELKDLFIKNKHFKTFHIVITFSRIAILKNKALVVCSSSGSSMDSSSILFFLKKENDIWQIFDYQTLSIS